MVLLNCNFAIIQEDNVRRINPVADPDLQIRAGGGRSSRPRDKGGPGLQKNFFRPFDPHFGLKIRGARALLDPPLKPE